MDALRECEESMMKKTIFILFTFIFLISIVSAQQVYQQGTEVDLKVPCFNNNTYCSDTTTCNITIIQFDGEVIVDNLLMTNNTAYHNYTLNTTETENVGEYRVSVICNDGGLLGKSTFEYIITPTGKSITTSSAIVQGLILLLMFGVTIFFLVFATISEVPGVKLFFNVIGYVIMFLTVGTGYILLQSSEVQGSVSATLNGLLYIVGIVFVIIMMYILINQTRHALQLMQIKKGFGSEYNNPEMF